MIDQKADTGIIKAESLIILFVLLLMFLLTNNHQSGRNGLSDKRNPVTSERTISQNQAVLYPGIQISLFTKNWSNSNDSYRLLMKKKETFLDNLIASIKVTLFKKIRQELETDRMIVARYHLFTSERDEYPHLS